MNNQPLQQNAKTDDKERHNTNTTSFNDVPDDVVFVIFPFLRLQDMGNLASVNREFRRIITNAFTNPNMYTAYPGMFEALCKFWHENPVAFQKWFKLYRMPNIEQEEFSSKPYNEACDYIFHALDGYVDRDIRNNALKMVFQNNTDDITQFLLPLVFNANQFALYRRFGNTRLQETLEAQIETWTDTTAASRENIHTLLFCFCLLFSRKVEFFNGQHQALNPMLDYAEKNIGVIFGQETIKKYGEGFIKALLQSYRLTLDAANGTKPTTENINAIRKVFPNVPINFAGANLTGADLRDADLTDANLTHADLTGAKLMRANFTGADLTGLNLTSVNLTNANLTRADLSYADLTGLNLTGVNLKGANLTGVNLTGAKLMRANFTGADLYRADLSYADLTGLNFTGADLYDANLTGADLTGVNLKGAKLTGAKLMGADLTGLNFTGVNLKGADLTGAKLMRANFTGAELNGANLTNANLTGANLTGADLSCAKLMGADLTGANLMGADLHGAKLMRANLMAANLTNAYLYGANLTSVNLKGADLTDLNLTSVNLTNANLTDAKLMGANLSKVNLTGVKLTGADLTNAYLYGANLKGADLRNANLTGVNLKGADLTGLNFTGVNLTNAYLYGANLKGADLRNANLTGADLTGADLNDANLFECAFSPNTKLEGIKIDSTSLLRVFIDGRNPQNATTNIWSLNNKMLGAFKLLLPHAEIKELEILMKGVNERISVHFLDFIFGALEKAKLLKLISDEIAKKQAPQKMECEEPTQKESTIGNSQQQNSSAINSTLALPNQNANTTTLNTELGENENHETDLNLAPNQSP